MDMDVQALTPSSKHGTFGTNEYWRALAAEIDPLVALPLAVQRGSRVPWRPDCVDGPAEPSVSLLQAQLGKLAVVAGVKWADAVLAAVAALLARYSGSSRFALGVDPREWAGIDVSAPSRWLPLGITVEDEDSYCELARRISLQQTQFAALPSLSMDLVAEAAGVAVEASHHPLFQVAVSFAHRIEVDDCGVQPEGDGRVDLVFSLATQQLSKDDPAPQIVATYNTTLFAGLTVRRMIANLAVLVDAMVENPTAAISSLPVVSAEERAACLALNETEAATEGPLLVHQVFEAQAARTPERLSYVFGDRRLNYAEFNGQCNRVAHALRTMGVGPGDTVGLFVPRSEWIGIGAIGTFKSGGVHVPLDPSYPADRLAHMVRVTRPRVILATAATRSLIPSSDATVLVLDEEDSRFVDSPDQDPSPQPNLEDTAYVFFTSGTTGMPKGIRMSHRALRNMVLSHRSGDLVHENNRTLQFASHSFAVCLGGSFMAWMGGGAVFQVTDTEAIPGPALIELLRRERINMVSWPVSLLTTFPTTDLPDLTTVISTAEPCTDFIVQKWARPGRRFINMYGSSEVAMGSTLFEWSPGKQLSIGRPFPNTELYVLDRHLQLVPLGVVGELCTGGVALADGYLGEPVLTAERFVVHPFDPRPGRRLYRTGDLGRYLPNGEIQYVGRRDFQVNIRGFRVELAEVEKRLLGMQEVKEVAVGALDDGRGSRQLVAWLVMRTPVTRSELRRQLLELLPQYMVPSLYVFLEAMPLTPNRKLDRLRLPPPDLEAQIEADYLPPRTATERFLAGLWAQLLQVPRVGIAHDFFALGGHSLVIAEMLSRIKTATGADLPPSTVFEYPTIEQLAVRLQALAPASAFEGAAA